MLILDTGGINYLILIICPYPSFDGIFAPKNDRKKFSLVFMNASAIY
jgi:hypothetical protein